MKRRKIHPLAQELCEEGSFDSAGVFTQDLPEMRGKLAHHQLPDPAAWVAKALQAAVSMRAEKLDVRCVRGATVLSWRSDQELPAVELLKSLETPVLQQLKAADYLSAALRGAAVQGTLTLETPAWRLRMQGEESSFEPLEGEFYRLTVGRTGIWGWLTWLRSWLPQTLNEMEWLQPRSHFAPLGLRVDGRRYPKPPNSAKVRLGQVLPPGGDFPALEILLFGRDGTASDQLARSRTFAYKRAALGSNSYSQARTKHCQACLLREVQLPPETLGHMGASIRTTSRRPPLLGVIRLPVRSSRPACLTIVRHGMSCDPVEVQLGYAGAQAFLVAPECELDLGQFKPVENDRFRRLVQTLRKIVRDSLEQAYSELDCLPAKWRPRGDTAPLNLTPPPARPARPEKVIKPRGTR